MNIFADRGRCSFKQFIPSKPDKYGIKIFILADSQNYYPFNFEIYCGKQQYSNKPLDLVLRLSSVLKPGHIICADNYFTSVNLSTSLVESSEIYYLGTIRKIRREIPKQIKDVEGLPLYSSRLFISEETGNSLLLYITKKNKYVLLLSNIHSNITILENTKKLKPTIILDYNAHKSGVDKLDQQLKEYRIYRINRRWPGVLFFYFVNFATFASRVIFCLKFPNDPIVRAKNRREFMYILGKQLIAPLINERKNASRFVFLPQYLKDNIESQYNTSIEPSASTSIDPIASNDSEHPSIEPIHHTEPTKSIEPVADNLNPSKKICTKKKIKKRCFLCQRSKDRKVNTTCYYCEVSICLDHSDQYYVCYSCRDDCI